MTRSSAAKRPWLAALLAAAVTGLGHLYLRRWRRALGWLVVLYGVAALFVDEAALEALWAWREVDLVALAPLLVVGGLSVVDAYLLALAQSEVARTDVDDARRAEGSDGGDAAPAAATEAPSCPNCGRELDPDIDFCHWCTTELDGTDEASSRDV